MDLSGDQMLILKRNDFLAQLQPDDYIALNIAHNFIIAEKNAYLYFDPQYHNKLYFVKEGFVRIGYIDDEGNEFVKDILQPGDVFGQLTFEKTGLQGEFAQAHKKDSVLCAFSVDDFKNLLEKKPQLAVVFSKKVGEKVRRVESRLLNLLKRDVRTRLLYFIWTIIPHTPGGDEAVEIPNYLTHEDIARLTGTSRQTVTTLFNQLEEEGLIAVDRKKIVIKSRKWLQKEAKVS
jgi:CRP/FNR family cyclic AMP-dependent transcriptional regulator